MARHEGGFRGDASKPLNLEELIALLGNPGRDHSRSREDAIACYLSGGEGWREAVKLLDGTFAGASAGLKERKDD